MTDGDFQAGLQGQRGQFGFPRAGAVAVGAARVRGDQQPPRVRIVAAPLAVPPAADGLHGEGGGVVVRADADPSGVRCQIVDPVRDGLAQLRVREVVRPYLDRFALTVPLGAGVLVVADDFLFFVSTLTTGSPAAWCFLACSLI